MAWVKSFLSRWGLLILVAGATFLAGAGLMAGLVATGIAGKIKARLAGSGTGSAANAAVITRSELDTILMTLSVTDIPIGNVDGIASGGGIEAHGETVVVATARGRIAAATGVVLGVTLSEGTHDPGPLSPLAQPDV